MAELIAEQKMLNLIENIKQTLKERKLCVTDRDFSVQWLGGSTAYWSTMRHTPGGIGARKLIHLADKLIAAGLPELGHEIYWRVMRDLKGVA